MTYQDDPNRPLPPNDSRFRDRDDGSSTGWVLGGIAALAVIMGIFFMFARNDGTTTTANNVNTNRPAATQPASPPANPPSTTGSGSRTDSR
jgi:hypothetical protein